MLLHSISAIQLCSSYACCRSHKRRKLANSDLRRGRKVFFCAAPSDWRRRRHVTRPGPMAWLSHLSVTERKQKEKTIFLPVRSRSGRPVLLLLLLPSVRQRGKACAWVHCLCCWFLWQGKAVAAAVLIPFSFSGKVTNCSSRPRSTKLTKVELDQMRS